MGASGATGRGVAVDRVDDVVVVVLGRGGTRVGAGSVGDVPGGPATA
jgi:hypothetical protein